MKKREGEFCREEKCGLEHGWDKSRWGEGERECVCVCACACAYVCACVRTPSEGEMKERKIRIQNI